MKKFIVFDGLDGSGKGVMIKKLKELLEKQGNKVLVTREPTDGQYGKQARDILKNDTDPKSNSEKCLQLFIKDREEHLKEIENFDGIVICDRYYYSTIAFQHTQGIPIEDLIAMNIQFKTPKITFILDLPAKIALERISKRGDPKEKFEQLGFMNKLRDNFLRLKDELDDNIIIIDASKTKEEVFEQIKFEIDKSL